LNFTALFIDNIEIAGIFLKIFPHNCKINLKLKITGFPASEENPADQIIF
jgi:hypothetical protein